MPVPIKKKHDYCTTVMPMKKAMRLKLWDGIKIAATYSKKTGRETIFAYHTKSQNIMSAITAGNCQYSGEVNLDSLPKIYAGVFHTHPSVTGEKLPCAFSSTDLDYFAQKQIAEAIVGCIDPTHNTTKLLEIDLQRTSTKQLLAFSKIIKKIHAKHFDHPYPYYPSKYKQLLKTTLMQ